MTPHDALDAAPPRLISERLAETGVRHGFFGRAGGVSTGVFASLNTGLGSSDKPAHVEENRRRCAAALGVAPACLLTTHQVHSPNVVLVDGPWPGERPKADAMVTAAPGLALGVLAADCMPFLFVDAAAGVIGAAHAGWRGALAGVLEATVKAMCAIGARADRIVAALGPCLRQPNFEVGPDLVEAFAARHADIGDFLTPGSAPGKHQFDLAGFARMRLADVGVTALDDLGPCTLADPARWFSYRDSRRTGAPDYGRNLSAITLA